MRFLRWKDWKGLRGGGGGSFRGWIGFRGGIFSMDAGCWKESSLEKVFVGFPWTSVSALLWIPAVSGKRSRQEHEELLGVGWGDAAAPTELPLWGQRKEGFHRWILWMKINHRIRSWFNYKSIFFHQILSFPVNEAPKRWSFLCWLLSPSILFCKAPSGWRNLLAGCHGDSCSFWPPKGGLLLLPDEEDDRRLNSVEADVSACLFLQTCSPCPSIPTPPWRTGAWASSWSRRSCWTPRCRPPRIRWSSPWWSSTRSVTR